MSRGFSRRSLLKGLGAAALAAPLWSVARPRRAAAAPGRPTRLVVLFTPHGAPAEYFWPTSMTSLTSSKPGDVSILAPLAKYAAKLNVLQGINYVGSNNHPAMHDALTNHTTNSIDTVIAKALNVAPLRLGVVPDYAQSFTVDGALTYENGSAVQGKPDPAAVFDSLVGGLPAMASMPSGTPTPPPGPAVADLRKRALQVTDDELSDLKSRLGSSKLADRVAQHQTSLSGLRQGSMGGGANSAPVAGCTNTLKLPSVEKVRGKNVWAAENFADVMAAHLDIAALALRCNLTRVVTIQAGYANYQIPFTWIGLSAGHHELSHNSPGAPGRIQHGQCQQWYATQLAALMDKLNIADPLDPAHTILDNTTMLWATEIADGQAHNCESIPLVLAGGGGGYLKTGQFLQYNGRGHASLLATMAESMGVTGVDFGTATTPGPLTEVKA
jgi:hypothetical protein